MGVRELGVRVGIAQGATQPAVQTQDSFGDMHSGACCEYMCCATRSLLLLPQLLLKLLLLPPLLLLPVVTCRRLAQHFVNNLWAIASTTPFYGVKVGVGVCVCVCVCGGGGG